jgi:LacI family transcriptional regulator
MRTPSSKKPPAGQQLTSVVPTIHDVARVAGVSIGTCSKALNGKGNLSAETRERVRLVAQQLGFRPNGLAQSLVRGRTFTVGLVLSAFRKRIIPLLTGIEDALAPARFSVFLCDAHDDPDREQQHLNALLSRHVDGIIMVGRHLDVRPPIDVGFTGVPVVYAYSPTDDPNALCLIPDEPHGTRMAIEHLLRLGRRRLAHISGPTAHVGVLLREATMQQVLAERGLPVPPERVLHGPWQEWWGYAATNRLLDQDSKIDAIFCGSDILARGVVDALRERGVRAPQDIAVVGFHNMQGIATAARPALTTVDAQLRELGRQAGTNLLDMISGQRKSGVFRLPCQLVIRKSCGATSDSLTHQPEIEREDL